MCAFLAGIAIAQLPYSREFTDRINPLTDLFVMVFFVSVALRLEASELLFYWQEALVAAAALMLVKFVVFFLLIDWQGFTVETTFLGSIGMTQISEFGIIVGVAAQQGGFIDTEVLGFLTLLALVTMAISVYLIEFNHQLFERTGPFLSRWDTDDGVERDGNAYGSHAVVIGYDDVTRNALPVLANRYDDVVVIDRQTEHIERLEAGGYDALYGEFRNATIRTEAAVSKADFVLSSSVQIEVNKALLREVDDEAVVFVEAERSKHAADLYEMGAHAVILTPQLVSDRIGSYLETYLGDRTSFEEAIKADRERLERYERNGDVFGCGERLLTDGSSGGGPDE